MPQAFRIRSDGFISHGISGHVPDGAANVVTEPLPDDLVRPRWDGERWVEGADEAQIRRHLAKRFGKLSAQLDASAERERARTTTIVPGQQAVYHHKLAEARALLGGDGAEHPLLEAEAEALELEVRELAEKVVAAHQAWLRAMGRIEAARRKAKEAMRTAEDPAALEKAFRDGLAWIGGAPLVPIEDAAEPEGESDSQVPDETSEPPSRR